MKKKKVFSKIGKISLKTSFFDKNKHSNHVKMNCYMCKITMLWPEGFNFVYYLGSTNWTIQVKKITESWMGRDERFDSERSEL